jgi:hypothetical protein
MQYQNPNESTYQRKLLDDAKDKDGVIVLDKLDFAFAAYSEITHLLLRRFWRRIKKECPKTVKLYDTLAFYLTPQTTIDLLHTLGESLNENPDKLISKYSKYLLKN